MPQPTMVGPVSENQTIRDLQNSPLWQAYLAALADLQPILKQDGSIKVTLDHLDGFGFSAGTKKKFLDLFGNANPLHLVGKKTGNGAPTLSFVLDGLDYRNPETGSKGHTSELTGKVTYNKLYTKSHAVASMSRFSFDNGKSTQIVADDLSFAADQKRGSYGFWIGASAVKLGRLAIDDGTNDVHLKFDGMSLKADLRQRGKMLDIAYEYGIKSIDWGKDGVGPVRLVVRLENVDSKALTAATEKIRKLGQAKPTNQERIAAATGIWKDFGIATLKHGGAIDIQDLSVQYHGMTAGLNGRIGFNGLQSSDFESPKLIGEKISARIKLHMPMALATDVARQISRSTLAAQSKTNGQPVTDEAVEKMTQEMVDKVMEKLLKNKWIRVEHGAITSTIEYKSGKLSVNGQSVTLPPEAGARLNPQATDSCQVSGAAGNQKQPVPGGGNGQDVVVACVNGAPITAAWLDQSYAAERENNGQRSPSRRAMLEKLVDQVLLYQKAVTLKLDQEPNVPKAPWPDRFKRVLMNYSERVKFIVPLPTAEDVAQYFHAHPALFAERRAFHFEESFVKATAEQTAGVEADLRQARSAEAVKTILNGHALGFQSHRVDRWSEQLPLEYLDQFAAMKDGQATITNRNASGFTILQLVHSELSPVTLEQSRANIEHFIFNLRINEFVANEVKALRASAKIEYSSEILEPEPPKNSVVDELAMQDDASERRKPDLCLAGLRLAFQ
jgi:EpsD family peptidyl-prolyl cis-trans isomerase